jgi:hypothetical protein
MVERPICIRQVGGSMPPISMRFFFWLAFTRALWMWTYGFGSETPRCEEGFHPQFRLEI